MASMTVIAKYAGVSQTTVSRVLNQPEQVKKETYEKVMAAITEWGYPVLPKENTRKTSSLDTIRLLVNIDYYSNSIDSMSGVIKAADERGYFVTVHFVAATKKEGVYEALTAEGTAGVIISAGLLDDSLIGRLNQSAIPFVLLNATHDNVDYSVAINNVEAGYAATSYLFEKGHRKIVWISGPLTTQVNKDRFLGHIHALQATKSKIRKKRLVVMDQDEASLYAAFEYLLALKKQPTAIVAATDEIAVKMLDFYLEAGWKVPEEISIIGIGNSIMGAHPAIGMTSVGLAERETELGRESVSLLLDILSQKNLEELHVLKDVSLFERATTKSP